MPPESLSLDLRSLKLFGMAQAVEELASQSSPAYQAAASILEVLVKAEASEREVRSINYQLKSARFPAFKDLAGFEFAESIVSEALVRQLHRGDFMGGAENVVLIGGPGTGKTHIATALGVQAIMHGRKRVRFFSAVDLVVGFPVKATVQNYRPRPLKHLGMNSIGGTFPRDSCGRFSL